MDAYEIINFIKNSEKKTNVKVYVNLKNEVEFPNCKVFGNGLSKVVFGDWKDVKTVIEGN